MSGSGIISDKFLCCVIDGAVRYMPLYTTRQYFTHSPCFCVYIGGTVMYLPCNDSIVQYYAKSIALKTASSTLFFITRSLTWYKTAAVAFSVSLGSDGTWMTGTISFVSAGNTIGLNYPIVITPINVDTSYAAYMSDPITITAGNGYYKQVSIYLRSAIGYSRLQFKISVPVSPTAEQLTSVISLYNEQSVSETYNFSLEAA